MEMCEYQRNRAEGAKTMTDNNKGTYTNVRIVEKIILTVFRGRETSLVSDTTRWMDGWDSVLGVRCKDWDEVIG